MSAAPDVTLLRGYGRTIMFGTWYPKLAPLVLRGSVSV